MTMLLNLTGLDRNKEGKCHKPGGTDSLYIDVVPLSPDYFNVPTNGQSRPDTEECQCIAPEFPYYRCTRSKTHEDDHAAHGGYKGKGGQGIKMFARWLMGTGDETPRRKG